MHRAERGLSLRQAIALGLLQGPAELLPVSSSGHTTLVPWLAGWSYAELDPRLRKSFEVALHAGTGLALAIELRSELVEPALRARAARMRLIVPALVPPALAGYALRGLIEHRLAGPRAIAAGLLGGAVAMALADAGEAAGSRALRDAGALDGLLLGLAQACALAPGVSRNGATLAAARARGFGRAEAQSLSWRVGLPVILAASGAEGWTLARAGAPPGARRALALGAGAAFLSTLISARVLRGGRRAGRSLLPYSLYRCGLAAIVARRLGPAQWEIG
jgi:undecaprenyl-diphosphatase